MTDPAHLHEPLEAAPLADARRSLACAMSALAAAVHAKPSLGEQLGCVHAQLSEAMRALEVVQ